MMTVGTRRALQGHKGACRWACDRPGNRLVTRMISHDISTGCLPTALFFPRRLPERSYTARLLMTLLVPSVLGAALAGLVVCAGPGGFSLSAGEKAPCPRKAPKAMTSVEGAHEGPMVSACAALPTLDQAAPAKQAALPDLLPGGHPVLVAAAHAPLERAPKTAITQRGPPPPAVHVPGSMVLRM